MKRRLSHLLRDPSGAAAAEMAMVLPLLLIMLFGTLEVGKFFLDEHVVVKAVRDGARLAGRQGFATMPCGGPATNEAGIKDAVLYGTPNAADDETPRLSYWTDPDSVTVTVECLDNEPDADGNRDYAGLYNGRDDVPYVTVTAVVAYQPLARLIGVDFTGLSLVASNQAPVVGI